MENIRQYILSLICVVIICSLIPEFITENGSHKKMIKFATGMLIIIVAMAPITGNDIWRIELATGDLSQEAQYALSAGQEQADNMLRRIITEQTQAYILDKAASMGAELSAQIILTDAQPPTPDIVLLTGTVSPYVKKQLSNVLIRDLAISEDKLQWK